ncbi:hypothetical protein CCH79_00002435 [Gambusia affinis]|uniref:Uncharacterized protein n=1 Tax=Gambusia affinis TaxID=33528 RepID=A0A315VIY0_GAMAF|nr:hypothetical protein CCH79_00002435 [Gambusia affinis]
MVSQTPELAAFMLPGSPAGWRGLWMVELD